MHVLNKHDYVTGFHDRQDWRVIHERVEMLGIPTEAKARAYDVVENLAKDGTAINMLSYALHHVLVPDYRTKEIAVAHTVLEAGNPNLITRAQPEERQGIFNHAASLVGDIADEMQTTECYDAFLARAGDTMAMAIVLAHQFADGNGRTARVVAELIRSGPDSPNLQAAGTNQPMRAFRKKSYHPRNDTSPLAALEATAGRGIALRDPETYVARLQALVSTSYN